LEPLAQDGLEAPETVVTAERLAFGSIDLRVVAEQFDEVQTRFVSARVELEGYEMRERDDTQRAAFSNGFRVRREGIVDDRREGSAEIYHLNKPESRWDIQNAIQWVVGVRAPAFDTPAVLAENFAGPLQLSERNAYRQVQVPGQAHIMVCRHGTCPDQQGRYPPCRKKAGNFLRVVKKARRSTHRAAPPAGRSIKLPSRAKSSAC
jgi:hypothetical protein